MKINLNELKGLGDYNFKKDKSIWFAFDNISSTDLKTMNKSQFVICVPETGEPLFVSKKGCLEFIEGKKYENVSKGWFPRLEPTTYTRLRFKQDSKGRKEFERFKEFCANRKSGNDIFNLFVSQINSYNFYGSVSYDNDLADKPVINL